MFVPEGLLSDPRVKVVPEFQEERYQSLVSVPLLDKESSVIGVISAHSEAPRELSRDEVDFLVSAAALVAGAIENARLYEGTRARVVELEALTALAEAIAGADTLEQLLPAAADGARALLGASACHVYLIEPGGDELLLQATSPRSTTAPERLGLAGLGSELRVRRGRLTVPLVAENELVGLVVATGTTSEGLARALAGQLAVGIRKVRLIERLTERNLTKDFLDELARGGAGGNIEGRAVRLGCNLAEPHVVLAARPVTDEVERAVRAAFSGSHLDRREDLLLGLVRVGRGGTTAVTETLLELLAGSQARAGLSGTCVTVEAYPAAFQEARHALAGAAVLDVPSRAVEYESLGAFKYLLRIADEGAPGTPRSTRS